MASTECVTDKILYSTLNTELRKDLCCVGPDHRPLNIVEECASGRRRLIVETLINSPCFFYFSFMEENIFDLGCFIQYLSKG